MPPKKLTTVDEAMAFLLEFADYEKITTYKYTLANFNLRRVEELLATVGNPHHAFRTIHIAGTKGKGSTAAMIQAILTAAGLKVGCFTSPHLVRLEERMTINGAMMPERELVDLMNELVPYTAAVRCDRPRESPTFFELVTALGFMHFARHRVDLAVVEVGLGGRLDATNVITPDVSVITRIDFDHVKRLGNTLPAIAFEKGGIIKPGVPVVIAQQTPEALDTLLALARERNAPAVCIGSDALLQKVETGMRAHTPFCRFHVTSPRRTYSDLELGLVGRHQADNAATAVTAVDVFAERCDIPVSEQAVRRALAEVRCPGRLEYFPPARHDQPPVLLDGAHNPVSIRALCDVLSETFAGRRVVLVTAVARDKDVDAMLRLILPMTHYAIFTRSDSPRAEAPEILLAKACQYGAPAAEAEHDAQRALARAREVAGPNDLICVTGSLYLAGMLRPLLCGPASPA